jgi:chromosome segregation protein
MIFLTKFKSSGFKSFATNVDFDFTSNMAGIVGPNGSGKSNIVDAIK